MSGKPEEEQVVITPEIAKKMGQLYGYGLSLGQIAEYYGMSRNTFYLRIKNDPKLDSTLKKGKRNVQGAVTQSLAIQAINGNIAAACFYLKTQMGWREKTHIEFKDITPKNTMTKEQLLESLKELEERHETKLKLVG